MSRLAERFSEMRQQGRTGLVTYVTAGDPDLERTACPSPTRWPMAR